MQAAQGAEEWDIEIKPLNKWYEIDFKSIWRYRDLLALFVKRDFVSVYKQTILGPLWFFIQPVLTAVTYTIIFGGFGKISTDNSPKFLFYLAGITLWSYFADCLVKTSETFTANASLFGKVYFPRVIAPLSVIVSNLLKLGVGFLLFLAVWAYYQLTDPRVDANIYILLTPVLVLIMGGLGLGTGLLISALTTKYRDLKFLVQFGVQLLMFVSAIVFPVSILEGKFKMLILLNPITPIIETFKFAFLGSGHFSWLSIGYSFGCMLALLAIGLVVFNKVEKSFMDTV